MAEDYDDDIFGDGPGEEKTTGASNSTGRDDATNRFALADIPSPDGGETLASRPGNRRAFEAMVDEALNAPEAPDHAHAAVERPAEPIGYRNSVKGPDEGAAPAGQGDKATQIRSSRASRGGPGEGPPRP